MALNGIPFLNFYDIFTLWLRIIECLYLIHITPYLSNWFIRLYIHGLRMIFHIFKDQLLMHEVKNPRVRSYNSIKVSSDVEDSVNCIGLGLQAIVADGVTEYFAGQPCQYWNLMRRNQLGYHQNGFCLKFLWFVGFCFRYFVLFPVRILLFLTTILWLITSYGILAMLYSSLPQELYMYLKNQASLIAGFLAIKSFTGLVTFESIENRPTTGSICVANHTSVLDVSILSADNVYSLVGQSHGWIIGLTQWACSIGRPVSHVWFNRFEINDRMKVAQRLRDHTDKPNSNPILMFPEGACINNAAVFMFKKGSFEVGAPVYPVCIKYNLAFSYPFWDSTKFFFYILKLMTSWAIVCNVQYLPRTQRLQTETPIDFANRVKKMMCKKGSLVDIDWDVRVKRHRAKDWPESIKKKASKNGEKLNEFMGEINLKGKRSKDPHGPSDFVYFSLDSEDAENTKLFN